MLLRAAVLFLAALFTLPAWAADRTVSADAGNIFLREGSAAPRQLTSSGRDSRPVLSPDGRWVVFVRAIPGKKISTPNDDLDAAELWQISASGKDPTMLVRTRESEKIENLIAGFDNLQFSTDGRLVYFVTPAWVTSGAVHMVDTTNRKERFVVAGNNLEVVPAGEYRDHLLVQQHRYFLGGGSYDWFYLFTPEGKEVGVIGEETSTFKELQVEG